MVAEIDGTISGYTICGVKPKTNTRWVLEMAVLPPSQGKGVGKALLDEALKTLREAAIESARLTVNDSNTNALKLYESFDFKLLEFKSNYFGEGENRFIMQVNL